MSLYFVQTIPEKVEFRDVASLRRSALIRPQRSNLGTACRNRIALFDLHVTAETAQPFSSELLSLAVTRQRELSRPNLTLTSSPFES
jgi:hypothetical protein